MYSYTLVIVNSCIVCLERNVKYYIIYRQNKSENTSQVNSAPKVEQNVVQG